MTEMEEWDKRAAEALLTGVITMALMTTMNNSSGLVTKVGIPKDLNDTYETRIEVQMPVSKMVVTIEHEDHWKERLASNG